MMIVQTILSLLVTLGILVTVHEFGHFWVARRCGVKVLRFSVGFGKPLFSWRDKHNTEFAIAAIPLGGYVKMLDEREGEVSPDELDQTFNRQTPAKRMAIASAGPIANFLFAIFAYWLMFVIGFTVVKPIVGTVDVGSLADQAGIVSGDQITHIDEAQVISWNSLALGLLKHMGESDQIIINSRHDSDTETKRHSLTINNWMVGQERPNPIKALGIHPYRPNLQPVLGVVVKGSRAEQAGLLAGDEIVEIDSVAVNKWSQVVDLIQQSPERPLKMTLLREDGKHELSVLPELRVDKNDQKRTGYIGVSVKPAPWPKTMLETVRYGPLDAIPEAISKTWSDVNLTLVSIKKMVEGVLSVKNLSGPITIAQMATESISSGVESFLKFLAILSVSLGVLNLLPIPVLDGGHLLYYSIEWVRGKPLSEKIQLIGLKLGVSLILMLMVLAFYNDLSRLM